MNTDEFVDKPIPTDEKLKKIAELAKDFVFFDNNIKDLERELAKYKKEFEQIATTELPEAMIDIGMSEFKLTNGVHLQVIPIYNVRVTKDKLDKADTWLEENGHGGMIKRVFQIAVPNDVIEQITLEHKLARANIDYDVVKNVHWSTIQSWANEMREAGEMIPEEIFNIFRGNRTVITE